MDYQQAGVDLVNAEEAVKAISALVKSTYNSHVLSDLGGFGGLFRLGGEGTPTLVATTDGVGTKTEVARAGGHWEGIGQDLVAMCLDDLVCTGARPLFFLDYLAVGKNEPTLIATLVASMARALKSANTALIGGEIAEHPGSMAPDQVDLAGFAVGLVDPATAIGADRVRPGDRIVGLPSPNLRSNGFSLVRAIYADLLANIANAVATEDELARYEELIAPSVLYAPSMLDFINETLLHAASHTTGGGLVNNLARVIPEGLSAIVDSTTWQWPDVFAQLMSDGSVPLSEMRRTFNLGIGMALVAAPEKVTTILDSYPGSVEIGRIEEGSERARWS
ncbi:phosphoribosylformylglycinamidine cyclo-ligase [Ferrimicrobium sp.]|uniref:phosphoribosylformylglycinamidine cyclo-ligase n=1 Tax=Ferrimicrobium sp. TaxID=2926050 RepID=UPI0026187356|nr:phosphoribosylformylglycinamidine cyclo-ligase [Ferrimicrobium sp.]